jgi:serine phosphatase RsbU (regulator of sigma subunit)
MVSSVDSEPLPAADSRVAEPPVTAGEAPAPRPRVVILGLPLATLVIGLLVTLALVLVSASQYTSNESRLLKLRVRDASELLTGTLPTLQATLASTAELADATNGSVSRFMGFAGRDVGSKGEFASLSLWRLDTPGAPVAVVGIAPKLAASPGQATAFLAKTARDHTLGVIGLLSGPSPRLGYAVVAGRYAAYAEAPLPANRHSKLQGNNAFTGMDYAVYLGSKRSGQLLVSNVAHPPLPSPSASQAISFGDNKLTLVMSSRIPLAGTLPRDLPWIIAILGTLLSVAAALMTMRLTQRRQSAEELAARLEISASENRRLYAEQRTIAQTLQHALLPDVLPQAPGIQASARYEAGERGVEVGGDWYDVVDLEGRRLLLVVGDVSGRGLRAATTMASLRYAIRAYAAQGDLPPEILTKLSHLVSVAETGQLATILCVIVDAGERTLDVTSAGHLPPLLLENGDGSYVYGELGLPIGVEAGSQYASRKVAMPATGTLVAFTDGLVELRGESIDDGLERLRKAAAGDPAALPDLLGRLVSEFPGGRSEDDIAIVGVRWTT